ncbi:MAG TPA: STAS domain-containing protein [Bacteroidales bacterium]|nr:STAS domain-containing protein [Bacteroidales bacterium]
MKNRTFSIKTTNSKDAKVQTVVFEGDLGIKNAESILETIRSLKFNAGTVVMNLKSVEKMDITTIQSLRALRNHLSELGKKVELNAQLSTDIERLLKNTGFDKTI